jgi:hypothetical protein
MVNQELDSISRFTATKAGVNTLRTVNGKAGCLFVVERAKAGVIHPILFQLQVITYYLHYVHAGFYPL